MGDSTAPHSSEPVRGRRLAGASSVYLRGAAEQAIDWFPWGPEAFAEAARLHRPILLDVGAAWCHWCHVMDEGTYSDGEVARLIGQHFVAVKVDRDEHPEVDRRYQRQVSTLTGEGGWPLTAFLTGQGEVFLGGTYFPPQDGGGRPGFRRVLKQVAQMWRDEPERLEQNRRAVQEAITRGGATASGAGATEALLAGVHRDLSESFDPVNGGFGQAPKFPHPTAMHFLLGDSFRTGEKRFAQNAHLTLLRMADGGMYDQIGGGFHRYSVDEAWRIPHFEKMGVDNAALLDAYVEGARYFSEPRFSEVITETIAWSRSVLGDPAGGFGASQDADNAPGDDGGYFTWSRHELRELLDPTEYRLLSRFYGVGGDGRMPHDPERNVLFRLLPLHDAAEGLGLSDDEAEAMLRRGREKLASARRARPEPLIDRALYANINGAFIRSFAHAGGFLGEAGVLADARAAADRFLSAAFRPGEGVAHRLGVDGPSGFGLLDDQAEFALGLVELAIALAEPRYLSAAGSILETVLAEFPGDGGVLRDLAPRLYRGTTLGALSTPSYPVEDNPHLAANAATALACLRLSAATNDDRWRESARTLLEALSGRLRRAGLFAAGTALGAGWLTVPPARVVVEGSGPRALELARAAERAWYPNLLVFRGTPPAPFSLPEELTGQGSEGEPRALICFGTRCLAPVTDARKLASVLVLPSS
jgi:uncharacterized protein